MITMFMGCRSDLPLQSPPEPDFREDKMLKVYVVNEGNFGRGSASISLYNPSDNSVIEDLFFKQNGTKLGDVCQSMLVINGFGYLVVNNSQKIQIVDMKTFTKVGEILNFQSPRYLLPINNDKAYVSDLYSNKIAITSLLEKKITGYIPCYGSTEEMILLNDKAYVCNTKTEYLYIINTLSDQVEDSLKIGYASNSIRLDKDNQIWVYCMGDNAQNNAAIYRINPLSNTIATVFDLGKGQSLWSRLETNKNRDSIFVLKKDIYGLPINSKSFPEVPIIKSDVSKSNFYGFGIHPTNGEIYVADALDFSQKGLVYRYQGNKLIAQFKASIIPSQIVFYSGEE